MPVDFGAYECYNKRMNTYTLLIDEQQRSVMHKALQHYIASGLNVEIDGWYENNVAASMCDMLNPDGTTGPLSTTAINSFVM